MGSCLSNTVRPHLTLGPHTIAEHTVEGILGRFIDVGYAYRFGPTLTTQSSLRS